LALGDHICKRFDCPRVTGLKTKLMDRHTAHSWAGVVQHSLDQRRYDKHIDDKGRHDDRHERTQLDTANAGDSAARDQGIIHAAGL
jgi:hypothetical protein